jgi:ribosome biogenesis protein YTM1
VSGHPDHALRLWDVRSGGGAGALKSTLTGHKSWVSSVNWAPNSSFHVASASHDGTVQLWDIRSTKALHVLGTHDNKALAVAFVGSTHVVSGK